MLSNSPMFSNAMVQIGLYLTVLLLITKTMGIWIYKVMHGESAIANKLGGPFERLIYRALGIDELETLCCCTDVD